MAHEKATDAFSSTTRKNLFLELAARETGATPAEVYKAACERGDGVTEEAYYNIGRRLNHRGLVRADGTGATVRYFAKPAGDGRWLEEDDLWELVDPDYPLLALTVANESAREMRNVPERIWIGLRDRLRRQPARELFRLAIKSYAQDFADQIRMLVQIEDHGPADERARLRREATTSHLLLLHLVRYGLGISSDAVPLPVNVEWAIAQAKRGEPVVDVNETLLTEELARRLSDEPFVVDAEPSAGSTGERAGKVKSDAVERHWLIGAVDGSTRAGVLSFLGEDGDVSSGHAPLISINTAVGQIDRDQKHGGKWLPVFLRLPERPEDMQREDNRFTVMAKFLYPDMGEAEYMHAVWNAMDLIEARAALRLLGSWTAPHTHLEVPAADVVLKDGAVAPQARDFNHYSQFGTYGKIVRDAIKINWEIAKHCKDDGQTVAGVVKNAQLSVFAPVVNWFACQVAADPKSDFAWPMQTMNLLPDQVVMTHLLTSGRRKGDRWTRSCLTVRPFQSVTNFGRAYRRSDTPSAIITRLYEEAQRQIQANELDPEKAMFWMEYFRPGHDPYVQMMDHVAYAGLYVAGVPRLDGDKHLPRVEFIVNGSNRESDPREWAHVMAHRDRLLSALKQNGFEVSAEHSMFGSKFKLDVLPSLLIQVHDTVKIWAADLLSRVQEYVGYYIARYVHSKRVRKLGVRPFTRDEYELLYNLLKRERDAMAGSLPPFIDGDGSPTLPGK